MPDIDLLGAARGRLAGLLDHADDLPGEVSLDICAAVIALDLITPLPPDWDAPAGPAGPADVLRDARADLRAAIRRADNPHRFLPVARAIGHVDDALAGSVTS